MEKKACILICIEESLHYLEQQISGGGCRVTSY